MKKRNSKDEIPYSETVDGRRQRLRRNTFRPRKSLSYSRSKHVSSHTTSTDKEQCLICGKTKVGIKTNGSKYTFKPKSGCDFICESCGSNGT